MKIKTLIISATAGLFLTGFAFTAKADDSVIVQTGPGHTGEFLLFGFVIVVLVILALWILKNSRLLNDTVDLDEPDGSAWLNRHLNDFGDHQLDILINRNNASKKMTNEAHKS